MGHATKNPAGRATGRASKCLIDRHNNSTAAHNPQAADRAISAEVATTQPLAGPRFHRRIEHLHRLGPRVFGEMLAEIAAVTGQHVRVVDLVEEYAALDPAVLRAVGGDSFPVMPLEVVR